MNNRYVDFISDEHFIQCVANFHNAYLRAKSNLSKESFYSNKIDTFKLIFDSKFSAIDGEDLIRSEILRQIDKSINNSIGTFHEQILGGINGYESGRSLGYDVRALDNTLFADIKNKHNTMNSSAAEALFQKLARLADDNKRANSYWVQVLAKGSFCDLWSGDINGKEYSHSRVYKISGDQFYALVTGQANALFQLYRALPVVIDDYLRSINIPGDGTANSTFSEINSSSVESNRQIIDQITFDNYGYYLGFEDL